MGQILYVKKVPICKSSHIFGLHREAFIIKDQYILCTYKAYSCNMMVKCYSFQPKQNGEIMYKDHPVRIKDGY